MAVGSGTVTAYIGADISGYTSAMSKVASTTQSTMSGTGAATDGATGKFGSMNTKIMDIAKGVGVFSLVDKGVNVLSNSVSGAVARFDTLNQYPKVMKQMGYSTEDTNKSVGILKKGVDGLPTSLQDLTKSAQSFAILQKSATGGAKTATALNDAFLASGASAADASRGVEQYSQMLSSGKVDLQSWKTLQETMPYALTEVAKSFGLTGKSAERDLYAKLQSGEITMDQLNDKFVELDGGVNGFANTARTASGGIGTSFTNMKNAVINGLANTITAVDNGLKNAGISKGIAGVFDEAKTTIIGAFKVINGVLAAAIPPIVAIFKTLAPVIKAVGPAFAIVFGAMAGGVGTINLFTKTLSGVKSGLDLIADHKIISSIILITAGFIYAYQNFKPFRDIVNAVAKSLSDAIGPILKNKDAMKTLGDSVVILAGMAGFAGLLSTANKLKTSIGGLVKPLSSASAPTEALGSAVENTGTRTAANSSKLMSFATAALEIGIGVGVAAAGIGLMAFGFASLASTGTAGIVAVVAMTVSIAALVAVFALFGPMLTANVVGIGIFAIALVAVGAAALMVGAGIALATAGMALLATQLPIISQYGLSAALGIAALGAALAVFAGGALLAGVGLTALTVGLLAVTVSLVAGAAGMLALGVATGVLAAALLLAGASIMIAAAGITLLGASLPLVAAGALASGVAMLTLVAGLTAAMALAVLATAGFIALGVGVVAMTVGVLASGIAMIAFGAAITVATAGTLLLMAGLAGVKGSLSAINSSATSTANSLKQMVTNINVVKAGLDGMVASARSTVSSFLSVFSGAVGQARSNGTNLGNAVSNGVSSGLNNSTGQARSAMNSMMNAIKDAGNDGVSAMRNIGNMIGQGLAVGMRSALGEVTAAANALVAQAEKAAQAKAKIHSPSRLMRDEVGYYIGAGMAVGMDGTAGMIAKSSAGLIEAAQQSVSDVRANGNITADASIVGVNGFNLAGEVDPDVQNAPNSMINLTVEQNWDGNSVRYAIKAQDSRDEARINLINNGRS